MFGWTPGRWKDRPSRPWVGRTGTVGAGKDTDVHCHLCQLVTAHPAPTLLVISPGTAGSQTPASVTAREGGRGRGAGTRDRSPVQPPARGRSAFPSPPGAQFLQERAPGSEWGRAGVGWRRAGRVKRELPPDVPPPACSSVLAAEPLPDSRPFLSYPVTFSSCPLSRARHRDSRLGAEQPRLVSQLCFFLIHRTTSGGPQPVCTSVSPRLRWQS